MKYSFFSILVIVLFTACVSTKSTLQNVDNNAPVPELTKDGNFIISEFATDKKYGYDPDYPVNVFYRNTANDTINQRRYLKSLAGPNGEKISYVKLGTCCPFPSKHSVMGAGFLDVFEIKWKNQKNPVKLYLNIYEKGSLKVPLGMGLKK